MREVKDTGKYEVPSQFDNAGEVITFDYTYTVAESIADASETLGEQKTLAILNRMLKVDSRNVASANAKTANGHSTRPVLTPEQKADNKQKRQELSAIAKVIAEKGLSLEDIKNM